MLSALLNSALINTGSIKGRLERLSVRDVEEVPGLGS